MPPRDWKLRIEDILQAISRIQRYTAGITFEVFRANEMIVDAVIRNLSIIGEAAAYVPEGVQNRYRDVPWSDMRGMRNVIIHHYFGVVPEVLWDTAQNDLPPLLPKLQAILDAEK